MIDSILNSIKKPLGLAEDYTVFDEDITMHINSVFSTLHSIGASPEEPIVIDGAEDTWALYFGSVKQAQMVKSYMYLKVKLIFDPPATSFTIDAMRRQIDEWEWRLNTLEFDFTPLSQPVFDGSGHRALRDLNYRLTGLEDQVQEIEEVPDLALRFDTKVVNP